MLTEGEGSDEGQNNQTEPQAQDSTPSDPFAGTRLAGKTPEEIKAYASLMERTIMEQSQKLSEVESRVQQQQNQQPEDDDTDFYSDPRRVIRQELEKMVKPINDQIREFRTQGQVDSAWQQMSREIHDFDRYKPYVEQMVQGQGIRPDQVTPELLRSLYYTAVGYVARHGGSPPSEDTMGHPQTPQVRKTPQMGVPQHRPSSAPLPSESSKEKKAPRKLSENEARIAREWGMTHEQFLAYQEANAEDVLSVNTGGSND